MAQPSNSAIPRLTTWPGLVAVALSGFVLGVFGTYWDDAWHTDRGRDSFLIAPHVALYVGIGLAGGALAIWALLSARRAGWQAAVSHPPLFLALLGVALTFIAAPIDNGWHVAFGRDAVIWSPPHMLGIAGSLAIAAGLLLELARPGPAPRWQVSAATVAAAAVVAVCTLPVLEYETDVPQFAAVFYLPVLASGVAFAFGLIAQVAPGKWAVSRAVIVYTALMAAIALVLVATAMPAPLVPLLIAPAAGFDYARRRVGLLGQAGVITALLFGAYVPYLNWVKSGLFLELSDVVLGLPTAAIGSALALWLASGPRLPSRPRAIAAATILSLVALPTALALGHDPGQGEQLGTATIEVVVHDDLAEVEVIPDDEELCTSLEPVSAVARRGGETIRGPLRAEGACSFRGTVPVPERGRWFVYAEFARGDETVETWLTADSSSARTTGRDRSVYLSEEVSNPVIKKVAGLAVYTLFAGTLVAIPVFYRRRGRG